MITVGLIGAGPWAGLFHAPMLGAAPGLTLGPVWARRAEAAAELAARFGGTAVATVDQLLGRCDAVAFSVPPDVQARLAVRAARAGRHLLLEKPLATTVADAQAVADAAGGVVTQMVLTYRYTAPVRAFLAALDGSPVRHVRTTWIGGGALAGSPFATPWRQAPGAVLLDLGPHAFDLVEAIAGPVVDVHAARRGGVVAATTTHAGGAVGHLALSGTTPGAVGPLEVEAVTDGGRYVLADPTPVPPDAVWHTITDEFTRAIGGEFIQPLDVNHGLRLQRLLATVDRVIGEHQ